MSWTWRSQRCCLLLLLTQRRREGDAANDWQIEHSLWEGDAAKKPVHVPEEHGTKAAEQEAVAAACPRRPTIAGDDDGIRTLPAQTVYFDSFCAVAVTVHHSTV
ncbi:unnamed protein product [Miscanthus lutarioriparius]|uniref:Secreted protein n=1 Tax=Miscanthus lutarioriparius TaxID=422564 RepID=A0A811R3B0_9POAL|nr:unnamed protein product [Miscanthus lutarioriparius]